MISDDESTRDRIRKHTHTQKTRTRGALGNGGREKKQKKKKNREYLKITTSYALNGTRKPRRANTHMIECRIRVKSTKIKKLICTAGKKPMPAARWGGEGTEYRLFIVIRDHHS